MNKDQRLDLYQCLLLAYKERRLAMEAPPVDSLLVGHLSNLILNIEKELELEKLQKTKDKQRV